MFLDDTACNLASLNLLQFMDKDTKQIETANYEHAVRLWTIVLEISVMMAQFPLQADRQAGPTSTARWVSATPISAAC